MAVFIILQVSSDIQSALAGDCTGLLANNLPLVFFAMNQPLPDPSTYYFLPPDTPTQPNLTRISVHPAVKTIEEDRKQEIPHPTRCYMSGVHPP